MQTWPCRDPPNTSRCPLNSLVDRVCCLKEEGYHLYKWFLGPLALMHKALSLESLEFRWKRATMLPKLDKVHEFMVRKGEPGCFENEYGKNQ